MLLMTAGFHLNLQLSAPAVRLGRVRVAAAAAARINLCATVSPLCHPIRHACECALHLVMSDADLTASLIASDSLPSKTRHFH